MTKFRPDPKPIKVTGCTFPGCAIKEVYAKGLCAYHYKVRPGKKTHIVGDQRVPVPRKQKTEKQKLRDEADRIFSLFIRLRDTDADGNGKCITCPRVQFFRRMDNGHWVPRQHTSTRYEEQNCHLQCKKCNGFEGGMQDVYALEIDKKYGTGTAEKLKIKGTNRMKEEVLLYLWVIDKYTPKVDKLMLTKNFKL